MGLVRPEACSVLDGSKYAKSKVILLIQLFEFYIQFMF